MTTATKTPSVDFVGWDAVVVWINGKHVRMSWDKLAEEAYFQNPEDRELYAPLLDEAIEKSRKMIRIRIRNTTNTGFGYFCELSDPRGEFVSGRLLGVDFGQSGWFSTIQNAACVAAEQLRQRGYDVRLEV